MTSAVWGVLWQDNHFLPGPSDVFPGGNEEHDRRFYSNSYDSFL